MRELFFHPDHGYVYLAEKANKDAILAAGGKLVGDDIAAFKRSLQPQQPLQQPHQIKRK